MRVLGLLLLLSGWAIVVAALMLLASTAQQAVFVTAGLGIEILGLILAFRAHRLPRETAQ